MLDRILVTGASGRLGSNLCKRLLERGETVRAYILPDDPAEVSLEGQDVERYTFFNPDAVEPWKIVEEAVPDDTTRVIPYGPGRKPWTWHITDVRDMVQSVELALEKDQAIGETFCIAGPDVARWDLVVKHLCDRMGEEYVEVDLPNYWHFEFDLTKAKNVLGYDPKITCAQMIDDGLAFRNGQDIGVIPPAIAH